MTLLKFSDVSLAFGTMPLLDKVSWQIARGERVCIIGRNGTGKSSMMRLVKGDQKAGQVTFHGPGQVVAYPLIDLQRAGYFVKEYVYRVEEAVIRALAHFGVTGHRVGGAPGIYVRLHDPHSHAMLPQRPQKRTGTEAPPAPDFDGLGKIAALGIKVSRHGLV